ncbi:MAG: hypothetical protein IJ733_02415 [Lachnospiraceae bacterium]|nr:hypothetical protein [Lachnospiraceae bacterium]
MRNIYFLGQNKSIVLYTYRNQIFRATLDGGQMIRPVLLSGDYQGELSDAYYRGTVYFAYRNRQHEILVKNVTDRVPEYRISRNEGGSFSFPQILEWKGSLLLLYLFREDGNAVCLEGVFPFEDRKFRLPAVFSIDAEYAYHICGDGLFITVKEARSFRVYASDGRDPDGKERFLELFPHPDSEGDREREKEISEQGKQIRDLATRLREKEAVIESVKVQYDDLMNTAIQYREEAKRWRGKYLTKK